MNFTQVRGGHTLRAGLDYREHQRVGNSFGNASGSFAFDNTLTRKADDTTVSPASNIGLSWAAFMLGLPTTISADKTTSSKVTSPYVGTFFQDTWRLSSSLSINLGLRYEHEGGITEANDQMIVGFDPNAALTISSLAQAAYAASPIPELPANAFRVAGGSVYASAPGQTGATWKGNANWMPRIGGSWKMGDKTVFQGGYGLYYDTINAGRFTPNITGYNATTTSTTTVDFGQSFQLGDPKNGVSPMLNPFPVRADGTRYDTAFGSSLGADTVIGSAFTAENPNRVPARVQRWRASVQRALSRNISVDVAYNGTFADHNDISIRQDYLPEQWYNGSNVRDLTQQNLLNANVPNPYFIGNFASLKTTNAALYNRMAGNSFFTSATVQRNRLLRPFSQINNLTFSNLPLGKTRASSVRSA
jgi:hypothetical protein